MKQSLSSEANSRSPSQEISCLLWNLNVRDFVYKSPPLVPILNWLNPVHKLTPYFPKIYSNIIFPSTPSSVIELWDNFE